MEEEQCAKSLSGLGRKITDYGMDKQTDEGIDETHGVAVDEYMKDEKITELGKRVTKLENDIGKMETERVGGQISNSLKDFVVQKISEGAGISISRQKYLNISQLRDAVNQPLSQTIFKDPYKAKQNLDRFNTEFRMDDITYDALEELRISRNRLQHPSMPLQDARDFITNSTAIEQDDQLMYLRFLDILKQAGKEKI